MKKAARKDSAKKCGSKRKGYGTLTDCINGFYDSRPANTILLAVPRGGMGRIRSVFTSMEGMQFNLMHPHLMNCMPRSFSLDSVL